MSDENSGPPDPARDAAREARGREARGRAAEGGTTQAYRSRSQSQRRAGDRRRERSPMRPRVRDGGAEAARATAAEAAAAAPTAAPAEPDEPGHVHLNPSIGGWLSNPLIQRLLQRRAAGEDEAGPETTTEAAGHTPNITFSPGGIDHRPDGTTTATFTIPTHMFAGGVMGGGRQKPKASHRVIRNLETLELSEVTEQNCPICYDAFEEKPLGWDAIIKKLAEQERKQEEERQRENRESESNANTSTSSASTSAAPVDPSFDFSQVNPASSINGPVLIERATPSERAIQAEADEILRARADPSIEENVRQALDEASNQIRYIVDTPEDAAAFRVANPQQLCPIIRVDPEAGPRQPFVIPRIPEGLREAHEEVALHRVHQRAMERAVERRFDRQREGLTSTTSAAHAAGSGNSGTAGTAATETTAETGAETGAAAEQNEEAETESEINFPESHVATKMPCGHIFGHLCICEWLRSNNSCPLCRLTVESEAEYLQATGQADESRSGGFFEVLFNVLPRVFQEIEADRRRHNNSNNPQGPQTSEGETTARDLLRGVSAGVGATGAAGAGATDGVPPATGPQDNLPHFLSRGVEHWPQLLHANRVETGTDHPQTLPPVADVIRQFQTNIRRAATEGLGTEAGLTGAEDEGAGTGDGAATEPHTHHQPRTQVYQPIPGIYVYHRPSDFFRLHGNAEEGLQPEANRVSSSGSGNVGAADSLSGSVGQETLQAVGTDGGDSGGSRDSNADNNASGGSASASANASASGAQTGEGLRSRIMEPIMRRIFRSRESDRHHPYRRTGGRGGGSGSGSGPGSGSGSA
ncbi:Protein SAN1 [Yarrowia sp. C11]|nr:Protein SAN1 [Yarrowia sp. E02]KAG5372426.1 Protein SAN1 [Yarrowia sp. C11]